MSKILTRKELYDLVWTIPMIKLAKEFNLSDNGLRKICKKHDIPTPEMGYWQKMTFNKKVVKIPLPDKAMHDKSIEIKDEERISLLNDTSADNSFAENIRNNKLLILKVPERLMNPDSITSKTEANLNDRQNRWVSHEGVIHSGRGVPDVAVAIKNVPRALRILDALIKNFRLLGYEFSLSDEGMFILKDNEKMKVYLREKCNAKDVDSNRGWKRRELIPNGKLTVKLVFWGQFEFADSTTSIVEEKIVKILTKVEAEFHRVKEIRKKQKIEEEKQENLRRIREARQKLKEEELTRFKQFFNAAHRWKQFSIMQEYFEHLQQNMHRSQTDLDWMKAKLDWYNPTVEKEDELLKDVDRNTLSFR